MPHENECMKPPAENVLLSSRRCWLQLFYTFKECC